MTKLTCPGKYSGALLLSSLLGCSPGPAPVSNSPRDPSNPKAAEGVLPVEQGATGSPAPTEAPNPHQHHQMGSNTPMGTPSAPQTMTAPDAGTTYTCPMHPEVISPTPGKCPKCGMTLVHKK